MSTDDTITAPPKRRTGARKAASTGAPVRTLPTTAANDPSADTSADLPAAAPDMAALAAAAAEAAAALSPQATAAETAADAASTEAPARGRRKATPKSAAAKAHARRRKGAPADPPAAAAPPQPIWQIYYEPAQRAALDAAFEPLDNGAHDDPLRELAVFERLAADPATRGATLWGALSWRFGGKTGLTGQALRERIAQHPGFDLYYCNPYPENEALYANGWQQGAVSHPAFRELSAAVLKAAGLDLRELSSVQPTQAYSTCNYFVGSPVFWAAYLPWVRGVVERARTALPPSVLRVLDSSVSDPKRLHAGANYWPFIVERLLPQFLHSEAGRSLSVHKLALPVPESRMNVHLQRLREMKEMALRTRSRWLLSCWASYRNLYLMQTAGQAWCQRNLPLLALPADAEFWALRD